HGDVGGLVIAQKICSAVHLAPLPIRGRGSLTKGVQRRRSKELQKSSGELLEFFEVLLKIIGDSVNRLLRWGDRYRGHWLTAFQQPTRLRSSRRQLVEHRPSIDSLLGKLRELAQAEIGVAGKIVVQPAEVSGTEDDQDALVRRAGE